MTSHKRFITYGKASRKITSDKGFVAGDEFARHSNEGSRGDAQRKRERVDQILPDNFMNPKPGSIIHRPDKLELPCRPSTALKSSRVAKPQHKPYPSLGHTSASAAKDIMTAGRGHDALSDGPSSGEDDRASRISRVGGLHRREDEHIPEAATEEASFVYDDESLQRHVAAETSHDQSRFHESQASLDLKGGNSKSVLQAISQDGVHQQDSPSGERHPYQISKTPQVVPRVSDDRNTIKSNIITVAKAVDSMQSQRGELQIGSSQARQTYKLDGRFQRRTSPHFMSEFNSRSDPSASAPHYKSERPSGTRITPPRVATANRITTPRQRELWNKLLNHDTVQSISTPPSSTAIAIKYSDRKPAQTSSSRAERSILMKSVYKSPHKRRKLVDNLLGDDTDLYYTDESSQVEVDASFNPRSAESEAGETLSQSDPVSINFKNKALHNYDHVLSSHNQAAPLHQGGGPKVTYARQRSYLTDDDISQTGVFELPIMNDLGSGTRKRQRGTNDVRSRSLLQGCLVEDQNDITESQGSTMRSIHELREAGGNARVFSEMEAMLDDIDEANAMSPTLKRSKLLFLAIKLQEPSFCRLFIDQGLNHRLFDHFSSANDILVDVLFAAILLCLLATSTSISKLSHINDLSIKGFLIGLLDRDQDLTSFLRSRSFNLSKAARAEFKNLWDSLLLKSAAWRAGRPTVLTPCVISLQCLEYLVRHAREMGSVNPVLSQADVRSIVRILSPDPSSSMLRPNPRSTVEMHLSVSILESCTISNGIPCEETPWTGHTLDTTVGLLPLLDNWLKEDIGSLRTLTLRLYLNLTNNNPKLCKAFSRPDVIGSILNIIVSHFQRLSENDIPHKPGILLDNLILSLGSMINLAEWCDTVRPLVLSLRSGDTCFLDILIQLFTSKQRKAAEVRAFPPFISIILNLSGFLWERDQLQCGFWLFVSSAELSVCRPRSQVESELQAKRANIETTSWRRGWVFALPPTGRWWDLPERWGNGRQGWFHWSTTAHGKWAENGTGAIGITSSVGSGFPGTNGR